MTANDRRIPTDQPETARASDDPKVRQLETDLADLRAQLADKDRQLVKIETNTAAPVTTITPAMSLEALAARHEFIGHVVSKFFKKGLHYGEPFPNSKDLMLYRTGAEWIASSFGVRAKFTELEAFKDRAATPPAVSYKFRCELILISTGQIVGDAIGECTTDEDKYKYRQATYKCPSCGQETIYKSTYGEGGWYCNVKKGGCGAKYGKQDAEIMHQPKPGRSLNMETLGLAHTVSTMAQKRAFVLAVRAAFGLTAYFKYYEDVDDIDTEEAPRVINGSATPVEPPADPVAPSIPVQADTFSVDDTLFVGGDIKALNAYMLEKYPDLEGKVNHAANRVQQSFGVKGWPELIKMNVTHRAIVEAVDKHMAEKAALA